MVKKIAIIGLVLVLIVVTLAWVSGIKIMLPNVFITLSLLLACLSNGYDVKKHEISTYGSGACLSIGIILLLMDIVPLVSG